MTYTLPYRFGRASSADRLFFSQLDADLSGLAGQLPGSSTDNAVARYDGTSGALQNSAFVVDDSGHVTSFGGNIKFPASQSASGDANTLDDYEEGTWTPVFTCGTPGDLSFSYGDQTGFYTKIGRLISLQFNVSLSSFTWTTASGQVTVTGMPFAAAHDFVGALVYSGITKAGYASFNSVTADGFTVMVVEASGSGSAVASTQIADFPSGGGPLLRCVNNYVQDS